MAPRRPNVRTQPLDQIFDRLAGEHPIKRLRLATEVHDQLLEATKDLATIKRAAVRELRAQGGSINTYAAIGRAIGVTTSRVKQIEGGWRKKK